MNIVSKVNIDDLINVLMDMRATAQYVDMQITEGNTLKIRRHEIPVVMKTEGETVPKQLTPSELNQRVA